MEKTYYHVLVEAIMDHAGLSVWDVDMVEDQVVIMLEALAKHGYRIIKEEE